MGAVGRGRAAAHFNVDSWIGGDPFRDGAERGVWLQAPGRPALVGGWIALLELLWPPAGSRGLTASQPGFRRTDSNLADPFDHGQPWRRPQLRGRGLVHLAGSRRLAHDPILFIPERDFLAAGVGIL